MPLLILHRAELDQTSLQQGSRSTLYIVSLPDVLGMRLTIIMLCWVKLGDQIHDPSPLSESLPSPPPLKTLNAKGSAVG
jgi:hypothetical protein